MQRKIVNLSTNEVAIVNLTQQENDEIVSGISQKQTSWSVPTFLKKFTPEERANIRAATKQSSALEDWFFMLISSNRVDPQDQDLLAGLNLLVSNGVISSQRKNVILGT